MDELSEVLDADERIVAAIVFGSAARDALRPDSDIDIALLYADAEARASHDSDTLDTLGRLGQAARRDVHVIDLQGADPGLRRAVFAHGRRLFDRSGERLRALEIATLVEYFDGEYRRRLIDEGHRRRLERALG